MPDRIVAAARVLNPDAFGFVQYVTPEKRAARADAVELAGRVLAAADACECDCPQNPSGDHTEECRQSGAMSDGSPGPMCGQCQVAFDLEEAT